jgi:CheY-like chemotaxis protein
MQNLFALSSGFDAPALSSQDSSVFAGGDSKSSRRSSRLSRSKSEDESAGANRVLLFGSIRELALYRAEVLRTRGFEVVTPRNKQEARDTIRQGQFDVAVLTYTLSSETVLELAHLLREHCPDCPLIAISASSNPDPVIRPDAVVIADDGPAALVAALRRVLQLQ